MVDRDATLDEIRKAVQESIEKNKEVYEMFKQYDEQINKEIKKEKIGFDLFTA
jgi:arginyl-tRNA--protein-N-Asp/Glu arginylyltransferase